MLKFEVPNLIFMQVHEKPKIVNIGQIYSLIKMIGDDGGMKDVIFMFHFHLA